ncbi:MAG: hypothetical protein R3313_02875 [Candidatus Saccharimonadales bacterium]|nr:hypothetical protein [Candidatus Saccharimonadales bacterium]
MNNSETSNASEEYTEVTGLLEEGSDSLVSAMGEFVLLADMGPDAELVDPNELEHEPTKADLEAIEEYDLAA